MNQQFDPITGQPINSTQKRFDPMTGQPIESNITINNETINTDATNNLDNVQQESQDHIPLRKKTMQVEPQPYVENPFKNVATVGQSSEQFLENAQRDFKKEEEKKENNLSLGTFIFIFVLMMIIILILFPILVKFL